MQGRQRKLLNMYDHTDDRKVSFHFLSQMCGSQYSQTAWGHRPILGDAPTDMQWCP